MMTVIVPFHFMTMEKLDNNLTERIQSWLNGDHSSEEKIREGAEILLSLNRNRILYGNIINKPSRPQWKDKLEYELKKFLNIRLDGFTRDEVARLDVRVTKDVQAILADGSEETSPEDGSVMLLLKGKRQDHDALPDNIKQLFQSNHERYLKIRSLHATLRTMENAPSCDRYEFLKQLDELDTIYRKNMEEYDAFVIEGSGDGGSEGEQPKTGDHQVVTVNRTWISRNKSKLANLKTAADADENDMLAKQKYEDFLGVFTGKVIEVLNNGGEFQEKLKAELESLGIVFPEAEYHTEDAEDPEADDNVEGDGSAE